MQSPRQLKVKPIDISPPDVLFPRRSENFKKHRFVATIPRFSTELLTLIIRLATGKMPTMHDNTRIKEGVYSAITSYDMLRNISKWIPNPLRKLFSTLNDFNRKRWRTCFAYACDVFRSLLNADCYSVFLYFLVSPCVRLCLY